MNTGARAGGIPDGRRSLPLPGLLLLGAAAVLPAAGEEKACLDCHGGQDQKAQVVRVFPDTAHVDLECIECHRDAKGDPHPAELKPVKCAKCHEDQGVAFDRSIHAELARTGVPDLPTCASCHGSHEIYRKADVRSRVNHLKLDATCMACHASLDVTRRHPSMPSPEFVSKYGNTVHGRGVHLAGLTVAATCSDCHGYHDMRPKSDPASTVNPAHVPETCRKCHQGIFEDWKDSAHGRIWTEAKNAGKPEGAKAVPAGGSGPICTSCHSAHDIDDPMEGPFRLRSPERCGGCHREGASTYRDTFHGKASSLGFVVAATCSDCHTPHRNLPQSDPRSSVHASHLKVTCGRCHPGADDRFVQYDPHLDPKDAGRSPLAHYVHLAMIVLLSGTFGFFGLHTALWVQRSVVAVLRREHPREPAGERYIRRFSPLTVKLHVVVVVSFLVLVATGVPMRHVGSPWASAFVGFLGGIEVTRFFHRVCAVLTFGYAAVHIAWLAVQTLGRGRVSLLAGPASLTPRPRDLVDLWQNLKWFLYLGPPPRFGRWTYFEKFDYFAVFWGVPVIGLSGLMLWFPSFFTRFLPGGVLNLATIVHGEEALLAGGFIFIFHFFHNHLRPENFPMDTSIFTGLVPLERFRRERPEEYDVLVSAGRLEQAIVPPPSPAVLRSARLFGAVAVAVGVAVVVAVLVSYAVRL